NARIMRTVEIRAHGGMITDRNGVPLAVSTLVDSVWVNPQMFKADSEQLVELAQLLKLSTKSIQQKFNKNAQREFVYLRRGLPPQVADKINELDLPGIFFESDYRRYYPEGAATAHILGFTNIDDVGQEG